MSTQRILDCSSLGYCFGLNSFSSNGYGFGSVITAPEKVEMMAVVKGDLALAEDVAIIDD